LSGGRLLQFAHARVILLLFGIAFVAASCLTSPVTPPALANRQHEEGIGWEISPEQGYVDSFGFVKLSFTPPARLTVHLGRQNLDHANTAWYSFTVTEGGSTMLSVQGEEGIPNIKGPDGNWWNDVDLDLPHSVSAAIRVIVQDRKIDLAYDFTLRRILRPGGVSFMRENLKPASFLLACPISARWQPTRNRSTLPIATKLWGC
jgi:hypothetical protein